MRRLAQLLEQSAQGQAGAAYGWYAAGVRRGPRRRVACAAEVERAGRGDRRLGQQLVEAYEAALPTLAQGSAALPLLADRGARLRGGAGRPPVALETQQADPRARRAATSRRSPRSSGCTSQTGQHEDLLGIYEKKLQPGDGQRRGEARSATARLLYEERGPATRSKAIAAYRDILKTIRRRAAGLPRARPHLPGNAEVEGAGATSSSASSPCAAERQEAHRRAEVPARAGPARRTSTIQPGAIECVPRDPRSTRRTPGAREALEKRPRRARNTSWPVAASSSRSTSSSSEWSASSRSRDPARRARRTPRSRWRCCCASASCGRQRSATARRRFDAYAAASREDPGTPTRAPSSSSSRDPSGSGRAWSTLYEARRSSRRTGADAALERELLLKVAGAYDEKLDTVREGGRVLPQGAGDRARGPRRRSRRWSGSTRAPSTGPSWSRSTARRRS